MAAPSRPLPYGATFDSADVYIASLLEFVTGSQLHQALCGGVHILDFLTRDPDLYATLIPEDWQTWFADTNIDDVLDLLLREDLKGLNNQERWRGHTLPPNSLLEFMTQVRVLCLDRKYHQSPDRRPEKLDRNIAIGMSLKKEHEVSHFAAFVSDLANDLAKTDQKDHLRLVDFGSGQNYLGRALAGSRYQKHVVALESRPNNIDGARQMDIHAKLAKKPIVWRNKKTWKESGVDTAEADRMAIAKEQDVKQNHDANVESAIQKNNAQSFATQVSDATAKRTTYIEHVITDGDLSDVTKRVRADMRSSDQSNGREHSPEFIVMSLHSCGNLVHHGLRSLLLNPSVKAVAMIGCCYNLCTERLGPPTYKLPNLQLRSANPRLVSTSLTCDPNGFPMSERFLKYQYGKATGVRFNITARMMAVQAPANWTKNECEGFFTRHFYRALLQRMFLDVGFIQPPLPADEVIGGSKRGWVGGTEPIIIGRLTKACYQNFVAYVHGAVRKISNINPDQGRMLLDCMKCLSDKDLAAYEQRYLHKRHELCVVWSLMAFAAQLVECAIVADRWSFLTEQEDVATAWVQAVFEYKQSPRNLAIVGIKK